ncbi:protein RCC2 homolog [Rhizophagus irregularis DAOM 181602=DAOM 197198]|nr:protein RCC2 homolog [Rhizophagus irregularis DAOM 181602=DAOM 197198]
MGKTRELSEFERGQIIGLWKGGRTYEAISRVLKFPKSIITDTIVQYKNFNTGLTAKRTGRLCSMDNNDHYKLLKIIKKSNKLSLDEIKQKFHSSQDKKVSTKTIRKNLHQMQIYSRVAAPKPLLTESQLKHGGGGVMVWGCFSGKGLGPLNDNAPVHTARDVKNWIA